MPAVAALSTLPKSPVGGAPDALATSFSDGGASTDGASETANADAFLDRLTNLLLDDGARFLGNTTADFDRLDRTPHPYLHAEGTWTVGDEEQRVAVSFGPEHGAVTAPQVEQALRAANRGGFDHLVIAGFSIDAAAQAAIQADPSPNVRLHLATIAPDVQMDDLLKKPKNSQLFTVFGQPRTRVEPDEGSTVRVCMEGMDVYDPVKNTLVPTKAQKVAAWFVDHDYDGRTFCVSQAFFPDKSAWKKLENALGGQVADGAFERLSGTESHPFAPGPSQCVAVKVIDPRGNEALRIHNLIGTSYAS